MGRLTLFGVAAVAIGLAGCVASTPIEVEGRVTAPRPPPVARVEVVPAPPGPTSVFVWQPGRWHWNGGDYVWVSGRYVQRPAQYRQWVAGRWVDRRGFWEWQPGHWA